MLQSPPPKPKTTKKGIKAQKLPQPEKRDFFRMRYFRFTCVDIERTIDFYKGMGMALMYDQVQEKVLPPPSNVKKPNVEIVEQKQEGETNAEKQEKQETERMSRIVALGFSDAAGEVIQNKVHLVFEEVPVDASAKEEEEHKTQTTEMKKKRMLQETKEPHQYDYLVVYVQFIARTIKRMSGRKLKIILEPTDFDGVKMAILVDPNGIHVRLVELNETMLGESIKQKQVIMARIGYYAFQVAHAAETALWYETLFQLRPPKDTKHHDTDPLTGQPVVLPGSVTPAILKKQGAAATVKYAMTKALGFRLVDMDTYLIGLTETSFYWLGNDIRTSSTAMCLTEVGNADTGITITSHSPNSPLIGIGFEVPNLDHVISKLKSETKDELEWDKYRLKMNSAGNAARFRDTQNNLWLELVCTKLSADQRGPNIIQDKNATNDEQAPAAEIPEDMADKPLPNAPEKVEIVHTFALNMSHLKGHARSFSEGAIYVVDGWGKDILRAVETEEEDVGKKSPDEMALALFITRKKSASNKK